MKRFLILFVLIGYLFFAKSAYAVVQPGQPSGPKGPSGPAQPSAPAVPNIPQPPTPPNPPAPPCPMNNCATPKPTYKPDPTDAPNNPGSSDTGGNSGGGGSSSTGGNSGEVLALSTTSGQTSIAALALIGIVCLSLGLKLLRSK